MSKSTRIPAAAELIDAVAGFLEKELLPGLEGSKQFNTRVSINALRIVQRELAQSADESIIAGLAELLGAEPSGRSEEPGITLESLLLELAGRIRGGEFDAHDPSLVTLLRRLTLERLAVDNPKYSSYLAALGRK